MLNVGELDLYWWIFVFFFIISRSSFVQKQVFVSQQCQNESKIQTE